MNNLIHVYQMRHVFKGDDHVGKYDVQKRQIRIAPEFAPLLEEVKAFFMQSFGIPATALIGDEEPAHAIPLVEFPDHIRSQMTPSLGDLTPAVVSYAKQHFTAKEFNRRYAGRQPRLEETEEETTPDGPTRDEMKAHLAACGIPFAKNIKGPDLAALYQANLA